MARVIVIGGIESTYANAQVLYDLGEDIVMFFTRGTDSPGWEGVDMVDESGFPFAAKVPRTRVDGHIRDHFDEMRALAPDVIYSLGWQQMYSADMLALCPVVGIHESLLPRGAGAVPIANAILHDEPVIGVTLFWLDGGVDTGNVIGQLKGLLSPQEAHATALYREAMALSADIVRMFVPHIKRGTAPTMPQDMSKRIAYRKIDWSRWPEDKVRRARVYPYA
jgi:folate-dependent phosphoribosylglycinamide formyltransferase PurN